MGTSCTLLHAMVFSCSLGPPVACGGVKRRLLFGCCCPEPKILLNMRH